MIVHNQHSTIWMNVTTSSAWNRPAVGIVRVELAICAELEKIYGDRFKRCIWNGADFVEWQDATGGYAGIPTFITPFEDHFPESRSFDLLRPISRNRSSMPVTSVNIERKTPNYPYKDKISKPKFNDVLISLGGDWDHNFPESFYKIKKEQGVSIITCCYDIIPILFPQYCVGEVATKFKEYFTKLIWGSSQVLCISEQTRNDFENLCFLLGAPDVPTTVIPLGDNLPVHSGSISDHIRDIGNEPFLIFVSTIERRKNHEILYRAYHLLCRQGYRDKLPKLVFVGMPGWGVGDFLKDIELDPLTRGLIVQFYHVNDAELAYLYDKALFCVYPSLYEGWGLPVGEALALGKAVVASDQGSLPEVGGDLVRYVDAWHAGAWADTLLDLVENPDKIKSMEAKVRKSYSIRKWSDTAKTIVRLIDGLEIESFFPLRLEPGYDMSTDCGIHNGASIISDGNAGLLMFGPHRSLPPGAYQVIIELHQLDETDGILEFKVVSEQRSSIHANELIDEWLPNLEKHRPFSIEINFTLNDYTDDFEIICVSEKKAFVSIEKITLNLSNEKNSKNEEARQMQAVYSS